MSIRRGTRFIATTIVLLLAATQVQAQATDSDIETRIFELEQQLILLKRQLETQVKQAQQAAEKAAASADAGGVTGKIENDWQYLLMLDSGGAPDNNAFLYEGLISYVGLRPLAINLGRHKAATGFNERSSSNDISFIERSLGHNVASGPFTPPANGLSVNAHGEQWYVDTGVWYGDINDDAGDDFLYWNGRTAFAPINDKRAMLHLGAHASWMIEPQQVAAGTTVTWRDRPELTVDGTRWVSAASNTGPANGIRNDDAWSYGLEAATKYESVWLNGEINWFGMDQLSDPAEHFAGSLPNLEYMGYYIQGSWIITGESKGYKMSKAAWSGVRPAEPFNLGRGGLGAWELAFRYSYVDLDDEANTFINDNNGTSWLVGTRGGKEANFTLGVNWHVNTYIRFMFNPDFPDRSHVQRPGEAILI
ncbi:MAG TPA: porin [Alphaproteobacteria bacterium]|nr:porin [Alphaproteobacteria bacterium]